MEQGAKEEQLEMVPTYEFTFRGNNNADGEDTHPAMTVQVNALLGA